MADNINNNGDNGFLYFMVGVLVIGLMGLGYFYYSGAPGSTTNNTTIIEKTTTERVPVDPAPSKEVEPEKPSGY